MNKTSQSIPAGTLSIGQISRHLQGNVKCKHPECTKTISGNKQYCWQHSPEDGDNAATLKDRLERHETMELETKALLRTAR